MTFKKTMLSKYSIIFTTRNRFFALFCYVAFYSNFSTIEIIVSALIYPLEHLTMYTQSSQGVYEKTKKQEMNQKTGKLRMRV